jgi:very-short-patch-repair endonuclease
MPRVSPVVVDGIPDSHDGPERLLLAEDYKKGPRLVFRRQVPLLGRFIADFLAPAQRLVIEVDGAYHGERGAADARRDAALERAGYRVARLSTSLIASDISGALAVIRAALLG